VEWVLSKEIIGIQYLRGVAAMSVVLFHLTYQRHLVHPDWPRPAIAENLKAGVDLFFVISGYIMVWSTDFGRKPFALEFMRNRLVRIVPLYWTATLAMVLVVAFVPRLVQTTTVLSSWHVIASFSFLPAKHPTAPGNYAPIVFVGWTLNYEMLFYAVFATAMFFARGNPYRLVLMTCVPIFALSTVGMIFRPTDVVGFYTNPIMLEFAFGVLAAAALQRLKLNWVALATFLVSMAVLFFSPPSEDSWRWFRYGLPAVAIVMSAALVPWPRFIIPNELGDASYSIYITHFFVVSAFVRLWQHVVTIQSDLFLTYYLAGSALVILIGLTCWRLFEMPITKMLKLSPLLTSNVHGRADYSSVEGA
jgi:peptidoglycan/LPS O-acetylase OafA/YrhL